MRFLLPHERWLVGWILKRQRTHRTAAVVRMEQHYGLDGMIWMDASMANIQFVAILGVAVFLIVFGHPTRTSQIALGKLLVTPPGVRSAAWAEATASRAAVRPV
jgi:hypothetical protein